VTPIFGYAYVRVSNSKNLKKTTEASTNDKGVYTMQMLQKYKREFFGGD